ncbi:hypothetical protein GDO81_010704 [Engystomops pustulosus]|uniref:Vomeronasal type-1 receptor n=1 Tax=Engystomops pustulosus TaxID=76066 RepID=A0AAV7C2A1_ENGPU|nr:hypothetical protein GDO81_010704 [Engystomops pustulosus]
MESSKYLDLEKTQKVMVYSPCAYGLLINISLCCWLFHIAKGFSGFISIVLFHCMKKRDVTFYIKLKTSVRTRESVLIESHIGSTDTVLQEILITLNILSMPSSFALWISF